MTFPYTYDYYQDPSGVGGYSNFAPSGGFYSELMFADLYYVQSCSASTVCGNASGYQNYVTNACDVYSSPVPANYGQSCTSGTNACGQTNTGTYTCSGTCSASVPANPSYYGQSCTSGTNACGQSSSGTYDCNDVCSAATPPNPSGYGSTCYATNSCGMSNAGTVECNGACSATAPSNSLCNQPPNTPSVYGLYDSSGSTYYGSSAPSYPSNSYRVYASATDPNGDNVDYYIQMYNNQTGAYSGNWTGWVGSGGWNWDNFLQSAGPGWYAFRAYAEDPSGATSGWSGWYWVSLYNVSCTSGANACGQTNAGVIVNGACNASAPSNASCPAAAASISVSPTPVNYRQNYTVSWSCTNSSSASLYWKQQGGGWNAAWPSEPASGSLTDSTIYSPTIYDVDCHAYNGATVSAQATQTLNPPTASLSASPTTINEGDSSTLSWSSSNATSCTGTGFGTGGATGGSASTGALATPGPYNYQLSCTGPGGSVNSFASVTVRSPQVTIGASPDRVPAGGSITVSWTGSGVDSCSISKNGSAWKQNLAADGNGNLSGSAPDTVTGQTTYAITCTGGTAATAASGSAIVNVASNFKEF